MDTNKITDPLNRGMVAGILGMPADMVNMLRNAGRSVQNLTLMAQNKPTIPMQQDPAYGQEWWGNKLAQFGYVSPNRNAMAEFAAGLLDPTGIADTLAVKAPMLAQGLFNLGDPALMTVTKGLLAKKAYDVAPDVARAAAKNLSAPATLNKPGFAGQRGAIVWHGSPHAFDAFDSNKIGTGEGQQAFGYGTYFGEIKDVAKEYAEMLKPRRAYKVGNIEIAPPKSGSNRARINNPSIRDVLYFAKGNVEEAIKKSLLSKELNPERSAEWDNVISTLVNLRSSETKEVDPTGFVYKVDIPDDLIKGMINWDNGGSNIWDKAIKNKSGPKEAAEYLRSQGITGIRYLDADSRNAGTGSSNFVVFPGQESLLKILERNGKPLK